MQDRKPVSVILDTDMGPDCDDAGALAVLHKLADTGEARILAIGHCTSNPYGAGCIDAINRYYRRPDIPVGTSKREGFLVGSEYEKYNRYITEHYGNAFRSKPAPDAVALYRRILSEQPDGNIEVISIGPMVNLADLLVSPPDGYSSLPGSLLVAKKVNRLVAMAGCFQADENGRLQKEWNVAMDVPAAQAVFQQWPSPIVCCGLEVGTEVITGKELMEKGGADNPVRKAYELYTAGAGRSSWDLITVVYAVRGTCGMWALSPRGKIIVDEAGITHFAEDERGLHQYLKSVVSADIVARYLEELLIS